MGLVKILARNGYGRFAPSSLAIFKIIFIIDGWTLYKWWVFGYYHFIVFLFLFNIL